VPETRPICKCHGLPKVKAGFRKNGSQKWRCRLVNDRNRTCHTPKQRQKSKDNRRHLKEEAKSEGCQSCGLNPEDKSLLHFHHRDSETKLFNVGGRTLTKSLRQIRAEIAKCEVLCAKCHREEHLGEAVTL
jgi:hypothetical protein